MAAAAGPRISASLALALALAVALIVALPLSLAWLNVRFGSFVSYSLNRSSRLVASRLGHLRVACAYKCFVFLQFVVSAEQ